MSGERDKDFKLYDGDLKELEDKDFMYLQTSKKVLESIDRLGDKRISHFYRKAPSSYRVLITLQELIDSGYSNDQIVDFIYERNEAFESVLIEAGHATKEELEELYRRDDDIEKE